MVSRGPAAAPRPPRPPPGRTPHGSRLRRDAYGPDRTNRCPKLTSKGHTDLRSCVSGAKFVKESDFDVKSCLAPPKSTEIDEKVVPIALSKNIPHFDDKIQILLFFVKRPMATKQL